MNVKKQVGTFIIIGGAVLSFIALFLPYGKLGISLGGQSNYDLGSMMSSDYLKVPILYWGVLVLSIAAIVMGFLKNYQPSAILSIVSGLFIFIILINNGKSAMVKEMTGGTSTIFGMDISDYVSFSKGIGWIFMVIAALALIAGGVITKIGQEEGAGLFNQYNQFNQNPYGGQNLYQDPNQYQAPNQYQDPNQYQNPNQYQ